MKKKVFANCELKPKGEIKVAYITGVEVYDDIVVVRTMKEGKRGLCTVEYQISNGTVYERVE
ncbi:MAG: hypothetical protein SO415_03330 [Oliverpabstia sp.]|nr:hypothetical protein [Oliverpabstia sp.]